MLSRGQEALSGFQTWTWPPLAGSQRAQTAEPSKRLAAFHCQFQGGETAAKHPDGAQGLTLNSCTPQVLNSPVQVLVGISASLSPREASHGHRAAAAHSPAHSINHRVQDSHVEIQHSYLTPKSHFSKEKLGKELCSPPSNRYFVVKRQGLGASHKPSLRHISTAITRCW